jgi:hypothetical protein
MLQQNIRSISILLAIALVSVTVAMAQSAVSPETLAATNSHTWQDTRSFGSSKSKLIVIPIDQPNRRQTCHIQSFTLDKLVCSRAIGGPRTYLPQQVLAVILPGDDDLRRRMLIGFSGGLGAAIWGTVVLAPICPACAVYTGISAFMFLGGAGTTLVCDNRPDRLLYLAPGQHLSGKHRFVQY